MIMRWIILFILSLMLGLNPQRIDAQPLPDHLTPFLNYMFGDEHPFSVRYHSGPVPAFSRGTEWEEDGFGIRAKGFRIDIYGNTSVSRQYATYHILEQHFGCLYLSARDQGLEALKPQSCPLPEAIIPSISGLERPEHIPQEFWFKGNAHLLEIHEKGLPDLLIEEVPAFGYREILYGEARRGRFALWNGLDVVPSEDPVERHPGWGLWVHTLHRLVPPEIYFENHPEYYALRNDNRLTDQVCLSNPEVLPIVVSSLRKEMQQNPTAKYWSVSQMDNYQYCECERCAAIDSQEGSHSGSIIHFVNALADSFPDKVISTLAYQYSRKAPKLCKPRPNVNIMLCSIECNRAASIRGDSFEKDLASWSNLTSNIIIWDYVINFHHFLMPFPNWHSLAPNLRIFKEYGVEMVFEQGYNSPSSEFQPLRNWLLAKLLWDPQFNPDSLMEVFIKAYYGPAAPYIEDFIQAQTTSLQASGGHLSIYEPPIVFSKTYLQPGLLKSYDSLICLAEKSSEGNKVFRHRVRMVRQYLNYSILEISKYVESTEPPLHLLSSKHDLNSEAQPNSVNLYYEEILQELITTCNEFGPLLIREVFLTPDEYAEQTRMFWAHSRCEHKAMSGKLIYLNRPDPSYLAGASIEGDSLIWLSKQPLLDGHRGWYVYQTRWQGWWGRDAEILIDLGSVENIEVVRINYLENNQSWIVGPASMELELGLDDPLTSEVWNNREGWAIAQGKANNPDQGQQLPIGIHRLEYQLPAPVRARYIHLKVVNPGALPAWRGVKGNGWLFVDEVEVL
jgi:hypothetical protein